jgi:3-hydroxymyristoyl/3-hydroxydecanoyl-(acyl carrier protein) dehydratase
MRPAPFTAHWQAEPVVAGAFEARLRLDDEQLFAGHYPGAPIFPGCFLIEALFQATRTALGNDVGLEEILACRFRAPLFPDDELSARFTLKEAGVGRTRIEATARGRTPTAELSMLVSASSSQASSVSVPPWQQASPTARLLGASFIHRMLPHRPPALLVDSAHVFDLPGARSALIARKAVTTNESCYASAEPTSSWNYPRSLIIESFCQACGLLRAATGPAGELRDETKVPVVAKLAGLRFTGDATPGDLLEHNVQLVVRTAQGAVFSGQTVVAGRVVLQVARVVAALAPLHAQPVANQDSCGPDA